MILLQGLAISKGETDIEVRNFGSVSALTWNAFSVDALGL